MGVISPMVKLSARAAESLTQLRSILGDKVSVDLLVNPADKQTGRLEMRYETVEQAKGRMSETEAALKTAGFEFQGELSILTRKL